MKTFLEGISRIQYVVGFFVLLTLRLMLFEGFQIAPDDALLGGDSVATYSLFLGLMSLLLPLLVWALDHFRVKPFAQGLLALGMGVVGFLLYRSAGWIFFFALGLSLLPCDREATASLINWRQGGLLTLCGLLLLVNVWWRQEWLLILIFIFLFVSSIVWERRQKDARPRWGG